ncbi:helix-turn-helix transcriptional regulator [Bacillus amyloliquefaciens]|uniref:helix-turn-helix transcriptional regulator n=1 Tax=Bacillus amyloliquefaciens group TaxID=1938374 RepID=UPI00059E6554|nr:MULTISPECIES: helix-turn-helix transcriptional regulator [Bacillus amyloliquefaciens group]MED5046474.1 helix-turn-helix transcriptional regulator [Bacillus siamensis]MED5098318.1 helix-turn-helix transcriptional regulator [Bacillus siamensis]PKF85437.1 XRE family transcriptional regulator [Bacillus velezensis]QQD82641.1 helix-turn-helix transcriptional regulator [Bacillus siamensis]TNU31605.1 helix-turn-helix transcriptional regulator [Bacillus velezensis]
MPAIVRDWLKQIRLSQNLTQKQVADRAGIARTTYASIEQGERNAGVPTAKAIAQVLGFHWTLFFDEELRVSSIELKFNTA